MKFSDELFYGVPTSILRIYMSRIPPDVLKSIKPQRSNYTFGKSNCDNMLVLYEHEIFFYRSNSSLYDHFNIYYKYKDEYYNWLPLNAKLQFSKYQIRKINDIVKRFGEGRLVNDIEYNHKLYEIINSFTGVKSRKCCF